MTHRDDTDDQDRRQRERQRLEALAEEVTAIERRRCAEIVRSLMPSDLDKYNYGDGGVSGHDVVDYARQKMEEALAAIEGSGE